jgi:hypothetical protein
MLDFPNTTWTWDGTKWVAAGTTGASSIYLPLTGGTLSGPLTVSAPTSHIDNAIIGATTPAAASFTSLNGGPLAGQRNMIINGDMRIDQHNAGASVTPTVALYTVDRWAAGVNVASKLSWQRVTSPGISGSSPYSLQITTVASYAPAAADVFQTWQAIEGLNMAHLNWGTAQARPVTISANLVSTLTGNLSVSVRNGAANRCYVALVPVTTNETVVSVTVPGDTVGTWNNDNTIGMYITFDMGSGANSNAPSANTWAAGTYTRVAGQTMNLVSSANNTVLRIKDVQVEAGSVATPFERRLYGAELALCQRYYQRYTGAATAFNLQGYGAAGSQSSFQFVFPPMRATPTATVLGTWTLTNMASIQLAVGAANMMFIACNVSATGWFQAYSPANGGLDLSAEL